MANQIKIKQIKGLQTELNKSLTDILNVGNTASQNILMGTYSIGIGVATPSASLDVNGSFKYVDGNESLGYILTTDNNGLSSWTASSSLGLGNGIYSGDGSLTGNRVVTMGVNSLTFDGNTTTFKGISTLKADTTLKVTDINDAELLSVNNNGTINHRMTLPLGTPANWFFGTQMTAVNNEPTAFMGTLNVSASGFNSYAAFFGNATSGASIELCSPSFAGFFGMGNKMVILSNQVWAAQFNIWTSPATVQIGSDTTGILINGAGTTSTTFGLAVQDSVSTDLFKVRDDGAVMSQQGYWIGNDKVFYVNPNSTNFNMFLGINSGNDTMTGNSNLAMGISSFTNNTTGSLNTAIGRNTLIFNTTGGANVALGSAALQSNTIGNNNTAIGTDVLANNNGSSNTSVGFQSMLNNTTGGFNTAVGKSSLPFNGIGSHNTALGHSTLLLNTTGSFNTAIGRQSGFGLTTGTDNVYLGNSSGSVNGADSRNTILGSSATSNGNNSIALGFGATTTGSNQFVVGSSTFISNVYLGRGISQTTLDNNGVKIQVSSVSSGVTDSTFNYPLIFAGSQGTGTGYGGDIIFKIAPPSTTGNTQNALVDSIIIKNTGSVDIYGGTGVGILNNNLYIRSNNKKGDLIADASLSANREWVLPNSSGTVSLLGDEWQYSDQITILGTGSLADPFRVTNLFDISINFINAEIFNYRAPEDFKINSVDNPDSMSYSIQVNSVTYSLGGTISQYDFVDVNPGTHTGFLNLNSELL